jgi:hypothetical protein
MSRAGHWACRAIVHALEVPGKSVRPGNGATWRLCPLAVIPSISGVSQLGAQAKAEIVSQRKKRLNIIHEISPTHRLNSAVVCSVLIY